MTNLLYDFFFILLKCISSNTKKQGSSGMSWKQPIFDLFYCIVSVNRSFLSKGIVGIDENGNPADDRIFYNWKIKNGFFCLCLRNYLLEHHSTLFCLLCLSKEAERTDWTVFIGFNKYQALKSFFFFEVNERYQNFLF